MNNDEREIDFIRKQLQSALSPLGEPELRVDLWPRMLRRIEEPPARFGWFESILVASVALVFAVFPRLMPAMLYHL